MMIGEAADLCAKIIRQPKLILSLIFGTVFWLALIGLGSWWAISLGEPDKLEAFRETIYSLGVWGWFVLLGIQYIQITLAVIPSGPLQVIGGALYGPWAGLGAFVLGTVLGSATIFALVRRFGHGIVRLFVGEKDILKYKFLNDSKKLNLLVLVLYLIPGTKDVLTYLFALTPIRWRNFIILSMAVRTPQTLLLTFAGDSIMFGEWTRAMALFGAIALIALIGLIIQRTDKHRKL